MLFHYDVLVNLDLFPKNNNGYCVAYLDEVWLEFSATNLTNSSYQWSNYYTYRVITCLNYKQYSYV